VAGRARDILHIGVSACLVGEAVRYDGGHKRDPFVTDDLAGHARLVPVCPEVGAGMGVPRETVRLVKIGKLTHMVAPASGADWTERMQAYARGRVEALAGEDLDGYVLKQDSPSCGMDRVKRHPGTGGAPARDGVGLFAAQLMARFPLLPVEEEGHLHDPVRRAHFVARVFAYRRLRRVFAARWSVGGLARFHAAEKLLVMAHDATAYAALARLIAAARSRSRPRAQIAAAYAHRFMAALARPASRRSHARVLAHAAGLLHGSLDAAERAELQATIAGLGRGRVPLGVALTLVRQRARQHSVTELVGQTYLEPQPQELRLRGPARAA